MKQRIEILGRWYERQGRGTRGLIRAIPIAVITYATALLGAAVAETLHIKGFLDFLFVTGAIVAFVILTVMSIEIVAAWLGEITAEGVQQQTVLSSARSFADEWMLDELKELTSVRSGGKLPVVLAPADPLSALDRLVNSAYRALEAHYGRATRIQERIDFEVTFMTYSYADNAITVAAWANRDGRKPTSMQQRATNKNIYGSTVTAAIYRDARPAMRIVENTRDPQAQYAELYPGQKERIKSSVVYPVLSSEYELLGTLVLHCDRAGFFRVADANYWREFCEVFAKRIAMEKLLLDLAVMPTGHDELGPKGWDHPPF